MSSNERRPTDGEFRAAAREARRVAFWGVALFGGVRVIGALLSSTSTAAIAVQAIAAEWGAGRLGIAWSDPLAPAPSLSVMAMRAARGALVGAALASLTVGFLVLTRAVVLTRTTATGLGLGLTLLTSALVAMRDELLLRGLTLRAFVGVSSPVAKVLACMVTAAAAAIGDAARPYEIVTQASLGAVFGLLWVWDRGTFRAWGAHVAWSMTLAVLTRGGLYAAAIAEGPWGGGERGLLGGMAAAVALMPVAGASLALAASNRGRSSPASRALG